MPTQTRKTILLATDQQNSTLVALDENQPQARAYTPYGHGLLSNGLLSLLGFNGELPDWLTGYYHLGNGYRPYSTALMCFIRPDSLSPFGKGGLNAYAYCGGDPVNHVDPTGQFFNPINAMRKIFAGNISAKKAYINKLQKMNTSLKSWEKATSKELSKLEKFNFKDYVVASKMNEKAQQPLSNHEKAFINNVHKKLHPTVERIQKLEAREHALIINQEINNLKIEMIKKLPKGADPKKELQIQLNDQSWKKHRQELMQKALKVRNGN